MNRKIFALCLIGLSTVPSCAYAGALDVLNTVGNIAGAISDTQRTLAGGKPDATVVVGGAGKRPAGGHVAVHAKKHK